MQYAVVAAVGLAIGILCHGIGETGTFRHRAALMTQELSLRRVARVPLENRMNMKMLIPLCATAALLAACGKKDEPATETTTTPADTSGAETTPGTAPGDTSTTPGSTAGEAATTPPPAEPPPGETPPQDPPPPSGGQ